MADDVKRAASGAGGILGLLGLSPVGAAVSAGFIALSGLYAWLRPRGEDDAFASTKRLQPVRRLASGSSQVVVGNARTGGTAFYEADREFANGGGDRQAGDAPGDNRKTRYLYVARLLSEGPIAGVQGAFVDGMLVPTTVPAGATAPPSKTLRSWRAGHAAQLTALTARQNALIPNSVTTDENGAQDVDEDVLRAADPVVIQLWEGLQAEVQSLARASSWKLHFIDQDTRTIVNGWQHYWRRGGNTSAPTFRLAWGDGERTDARVTSRAVARALSRAPGWRLTDIVEGVAWAFCEFRMWDREDQLFPYNAGSVPDVEFLVRGNPAFASANPAHGANPAKVADWYLKTYCGASDAHVADITAAAAHCDTLVTIPAVSRTDPAAPTAQRPITGPQVLASFYGEDLPANAVQDRVLAEWNAREAGAANARPRYAANGIIDGDMERDDVLDSLGVCMGGHVVDVGGQWHVRPGTNEAPVMIVQDEEILGDAVQWVPDSGVGQAPNSLEVSIAQDRERGWTDSRLPPVDDTTHVGRDGLYRRSLRLPFVNDALDAQRLAHLYLRRDAYGLRRARWTLRGDTSPANALIPTQFVQLQVEELNLRMRVIATARSRGVVAVDAIECPDDVYTTQFLLPSQARDFTVQPPDPSAFDLSARFDWAWQFVDGNVRLDLIPFWGADVGSVKVRVVKSPADAESTLGTTAWEYVLTGAELPVTGEPFQVLAVAAPAMIEDVSINPKASSALFPEGPAFHAAIQLIGYSSDAYTAINAGDVEGEPSAISLVVPHPTDGGTGTSGILDNLAWAAVDPTGYRLDMSARAVEGVKSIRVKGTWDYDAQLGAGPAPVGVAALPMAAIPARRRRLVAFDGKLWRYTDASTTLVFEVDTTTGATGASRLLYAGGALDSFSEFGVSGDNVFFEVDRVFPDRDELYAYSISGRASRSLGTLDTIYGPSDMAVVGGVFYYLTRVGGRRYFANSGEVLWRLDSFPDGFESDRAVSRLGRLAEPRLFTTDGVYDDTTDGTVFEIGSMAVDGDRLLCVGYAYVSGVLKVVLGEINATDSPPRVTLLSELLDVPITRHTRGPSAGDFAGQPVFSFGGVSPRSLAVLDGFGYLTTNGASAAADATPPIPASDAQIYKFPIPRAASAGASGQQTMAPLPERPPIREVYEYILNGSALPAVGEFVESLRDVPHETGAPGYVVMTNPADSPPAKFESNDQAVMTLEMNEYASADGTGEALASGRLVVRGPGTLGGGTVEVEFDDVERTNVNTANVYFRSMRLYGLRATEGAEPVYRPQGVADWIHASLHYNDPDATRQIVSAVPLDSDGNAIGGRWNLIVADTFAFASNARKLFLAARTGTDAGSYAYHDIKVLEMFESPEPAAAVLRRTAAPGPDDRGDFEGQIWAVVEAADDDADEG